MLVKKTEKKCFQEEHFCGTFSNGSPLLSGAEHFLLSCTCSSRCAKRDARVAAEREKERARVLLPSCGEAVGQFGKKGAVGLWETWRPKTNEGL